MGPLARTAKSVPGSLPQPYSIPCFDTTKFFSLEGLFIISMPMTNQPGILLRFFHVEAIAYKTLTGCT